jgi:putative transposase
MVLMTEFKKNRHSIYNLKYHLIVVTKYRHRCITDAMMKDIEDICRRLLENKKCDLLEFDGEPDHIHILFDTPPQIQLSSLINNLKTVFSRLIRKKYADHLQKYYWKPIFWSKSYCILTTGGATIETIREYIQSQGKSPHSSPPKP